MENLIKPGKHLFSGIDTNTVGGANSYIFVLDGITYEAWEDECDGYRSWACISKSDKKCRYTFPPQEVIILEHETPKEDYVCLKLYDIINGKLILRIETDNYDDYYPYAIFEYHPENMKINEIKK